MKTYAILISTNKVYMVPFHGGEYEVIRDQIRPLLDCEWFEIVRAINMKKYTNHERAGYGKSGLVMLVDEEGLLKGKEPNPIASAIYDGPIVGNALLVYEDWEDSEGEFRGMREDSVMDIAGRMYKLALEGR